MGKYSRYARSNARPRGESDLRLLGSLPASIFNARGNQLKYKRNLANSLAIVQKGMQECKK